jgi:hypothetical protein
VGVRSQVSALFLILVFSVCWIVARGYAYGTGTIDVNSGDWAKYEVDRSGQLGEMCHVPGFTEWFLVKVENVCEPMITLNKTFHLVNGTEISEVATLDMNDNDVTWYFFRANLSKGDLVSGWNWVDPHLPIPETLQINDTLLMPIGGVSRLVNVVKTNSVRGFFEEEADYSERYQWDKETGVLTEREFLVISTKTGQTLIKDRVALVDTNMWDMQIPMWKQPPVWLVLGSITLIGAGLIVKRSRKEKM